MDPKDTKNDILGMDTDDAVGLSDIIEILSTLDNQSPDLNNTLAQHLEQSMQPPQPFNAHMPAAHNVAQQPTHHNIVNVQSAQQAANNNRVTPKPFINIVEQPASKALRFRYECEGRSAGSIPGVNSTPENKTYPTIEIVGYKGDVIVVVSCVTKDPPYRPHPHKLVGKDGCKNGVCRVDLSADCLRAVFSNLGIQCVKKKDVRMELENREKLKVDPFKTNFDHKDQPSSIDLNSVRLAFQAFLKTASGGYKPLKAVVSDPIYDKKAMSDLVICRLCSCAANVNGGTEIILLCEKVVREDIKVKFFELNSEDKVIWEDYAQFQQSDIHKQTAITFKTPRYHKTDITESAKVFIQLVRPSDKATSEPLPFEYFPDQDQIKRKRLRDNGSAISKLKKELQQPDTQFQNDFSNISSPWTTPFVPDIKTEPAMSPQQPFAAYRSPYQMSPSPQPLSPMNRNDTPSPAMMMTLTTPTNNNNNNNLNGQITMFNFNAVGTDQRNSTVFGIQQQQQQYSGNPFMFNDTHDKNFVPVNMNMNITAYNVSGTTSNNNNNNNNTNAFFDHQSIAPTTSGGSITPLWNENRNFANILNNFMEPVMLKDQQQSQQHQQQQQQQNQQQQILQMPNDLSALVSNEPAGEERTLSGLLALVDSEQLLSMNSDELALSNLSITT